MLFRSAPIAGMIVANDLDRELRDRPLQRGDALFRIADLDGEWQLRLFISDRDGGYVQDQLQSASVPIDWGLENGAGQVFRGSLQELSLDVDHRPMKGAYRIGIASLDSKQIDHPVIGSVAYARIPCGYQPLWFVWSRPLVEFLQKRFWLTGTTLSLAHELARNPK